MKQTRYLTCQCLQDVSITYVNMNKCGFLLQRRNNGTYRKSVIKATPE